MATEKTMYWLTLGVLALTFNHAAINHSLFNRVETIADQISERLATQSDLVLGRGHSKFAQSQAKLACAQSQLASLQASMVLRQADFAHFQAERAQFIVMQQPQCLSIVCPRVKIRAAIDGMQIPTPPAVNVEGSL